MTIYYIRPDVGSNANNGSSWALAWSSLYALRARSVTLAAGDVIRIEKSDTKAVTLTVGQATVQPYPYGATNYAAYAQSSSRLPVADTGFDWIASQTFTTFTQSAYGVFFSSNTGVINTPSAKLAYIENDYTPDISTFQAISLPMRMSVAYGGTGEEHIPPGTFELWMCSDTVGNTPVLVIPINTWIRNSTTLFSSTYYIHTSVFPVDVNSYSLRRTSATLTRDTSSWGITLERPTLFKPWAAAQPSGLHVALHIPLQYPPNNVVNRCFIQNVTPGIGWFEGYGIHLLRGIDDPNNPIGTAASLWTYGPSNTTAQTMARAFLIPGTHMVGTDKWPTGSTVAAFDLNGSAGGAVGNPVIIEGGYDTVSSTVTGETIFSGGRDSCYGTQVTFLDLQGAAHVEIRNISALYGFGALLANPAVSVKISTCQFTVCGTPILNLNSAVAVTLDYCNSSRDGATEWGVMGNLTISNSIFSQYNVTLPASRIVECGTLALNTSALITTAGGDVTLSVRDNATVTGYMYLAGLKHWGIAQLTNWDKTLTFSGNVTCSYTSVSGFGVNYILHQTHPTSRWAVIKYSGLSQTPPNVNTGFGSMPPSMDEEIFFDAPTADIVGWHSGFQTTAARTDNTWVYTISLVGFPVTYSGVGQYLADSSNKLKPRLKSFAESSLASNTYGGASSVANTYSYTTASVGTENNIGNFVYNDKNVCSQRYPYVASLFYYTDTWPWSSKTYRTYNAGKTVGIAMLPGNVNLRHNDRVIYTQVAATINPNISGPSRLSIADMFSSTVGPISHYLLEGGQEYMLRASVLLQVNLSTNPGFTSNTLPPANSAGTASSIVVSNPSVIGAQTIVFSLVSMSCFAHSVMYYEHTENDPIIKVSPYSFVDIEIPVSPVYDGEVAIFMTLLSSVGGNGALVDNLRLEAAI